MILSRLDIWEMRNKPSVAPRSQDFLNSCKFLLRKNLGFCKICDGWKLGHQNILYKIVWTIFLLNLGILFCVSDLFLHTLQVDLAKFLRTQEFRKRVKFQPGEQLRSRVIFSFFPKVDLDRPVGSSIISASFLNVFTAKTRLECSIFTQILAFCKNLELEARIWKTKIHFPKVSTPKPHSTNIRGQLCQISASKNKENDF